MYKEVNGVKLYSEDDMVVRKFNKEGNFEKLTFDYFLSEIEKLTENDCFIDVGAYTGIYSLLAKLNNEKVPVFSFEPNPYCISRISENIVLNSLKPISNNFNVFNIALSDKEVSQEFHTKKSMKMSSGSMIGTNLRPGIYNDTREVLTKTLDSFLGREETLCFSEYCKPALIKIDVEGHEFEVMNGAIGILERYKPKLIVEINDEEHEKAVKGLLSHFGYKHILVLDGRNFIFE